MDSCPNYSEESQVRGNLGLASQSGRCLEPLAEHPAGPYGRHGEELSFNCRFREEKENPLAHSPRACDRF
jgi:hypothetical protein